MLYALLIYSPRPPDEPYGADELESILVEHRALQARTRASGAFKGSAKLVGYGGAHTVRKVGGRQVVMDGPFAETKEWLAGFYLIECDSADAALEHARCLCLEEGQAVEARPVDWHALS